MATAEKRTLSIEARLKDHLTKELGVMERSLTRFAYGGLIGIKRLAGVFLSLKSAVVGAVAAYGGLRAVSAVAEQVDALSKLARTTGDTIANLSELQGAFEAVGVKADQFDDVLRTLQNAQRDAVDGSEKQREAFADLGISMEQVRDLAPSQLFEQIARGLGGLNSEFDRQVALSKLLPKQFQALMPVLGGGLREFQQAILEARASGATVTDEQASIAARLGDAYTKLKNSLSLVGRAFIESFGPRSVALIEVLAKGIAKFHLALAPIGEFFSFVLPWAIDFAINRIIDMIEILEKIPGVDLLGSGLPAQIRTMVADLEREAYTLRTKIGRGLDFTGELKPKLAEVEKQIANLNESVSFGLAGYLRRSKEKVIREIDDITKQVRDAAAGAGAKSPDETAAALGLPTSNDIGVWEREAKKQIQAAMAASGAAAAVAGSVFQTPPRQAQAPSERDGLTNLRERFAILRQLGALAPNVKAVQDAIAEIDAQAMVLELVEAKAGVLSAQELAAAVQLVKDKLDATKASSDGFFGSFAAGAKDALRQWGDFAGTVKSSAALLVNQSLDGLTDVFADIVTRTKSAREAWTDYAKNMLRLLAKIIAQLFIAKSLEAAFGGPGLPSLGLEKGGVVPMERGGIRAFAAGGVNRNGGIARRPTVLFGEGRTAEAFVPLPDNRSIPVSFVGGGPSGGNVINFVIHAMDSRDVQRALYEQQGTLRTIFTNQAETQHGMRQVIRRAAG